MINFLELAKQEVAKYLGIDVQEVFVVWSVKVLQNNKALLSAPGKGVPYFEVTHNGDEKEMYLDVYDKRENIVIKY